MKCKLSQVPEGFRFVFPEPTAIAQLIDDLWPVLVEKSDVFRKVSGDYETAIIQPIDSVRIIRPISDPDVCVLDRWAMDQVGDKNIIRLGQPIHQSDGETIIVYTFHKSLNSGGIIIKNTNPPYNLKTIMPNPKDGNLNIYLPRRHDD